jgi:hypothetical protein
MIVQKLNEYYKKEEDIHIVSEGFKMKPPTYKEKVFSSLLHLMMDEQGISEKSFKETDNLIEKLKEFFKDEKVDNVINEFEEEGRRNTYCAEFIYDAMIKNK